MTGFIFNFYYHDKIICLRYHYSNSLNQSRQTDRDWSIHRMMITSGVAIVFLLAVLFCLNINPFLSLRVSQQWSVVSIKWSSCFFFIIQKLSISLSWWFDDFSSFVSFGIFSFALTLTFLVFKLSLFYFAALRFWSFQTCHSIIHVPFHIFSSILFPVSLSLYLWKTGR